MPHQMHATRDARLNADIRSWVMMSTPGHDDYDAHTRRADVCSWVMMRIPGETYFLHRLFSKLYRADQRMTWLQWLHQWSAEQVADLCRSL